MLTEVTDHKRDYSAITTVDGFITSSNGNLHFNNMTRCWKLLVECKDGSVDWVPLKDLKHSNPVELTKYAVVNKIIDGPVFGCWFKDTLRCQDRIISKLKSKYCHTSHKFYIQVTKTVKEAYEINRKSGTDFWTKAIAKLITNICISFEKIYSVTPNDTMKVKIDLNISPSMRT